MKIKINFPKAGMGIDEGTVVRWVRRTGDRVEEGDVLVEMETAKAIQEVVAPASGTIVEIVAGDGETVQVNSALGYLEDTST